MSPTIFSDIYHIVRQLENDTFMRKTDRQEGEISSSNFVLLLIVFTVSLGIQTAILYFTGKVGQNEAKQKPFF